MNVQRPRVPLRRITAALAGLVVTILTGCGGDPTRTVEITIRHSAFEPSLIEAAPGETVRFVITNLDPIDHEFILGDDLVQQRHENGTEPHHGTVPGEVSIPPGGTRATSYGFAGPGALPFGCHLPGHWGYGMRGEVLVG